MLGLGVNFGSNCACTVYVQSNVVILFPNGAWRKGHVNDWQSIPEPNQSEKIEMLTGACRIIISRASPYS